MKFNLKRPCADCPFRQDCAPGWLGKKAVSIVELLAQQNETFACHETISLRESPNPDEDDSHCAGALLMLQQAHKINDNWRLRLAQQFRLLDVAQLLTNVPVFESTEAFIQHHA